MVEEIIIDPITIVFFHTAVFKAILTGIRRSGA